jgi:hypothetical protein
MKPPVDGGARLVDPNVKGARVRLLVTIVLVGTLVSIVWHYVSGFYVGQGYPRSTFLFRPDDYFNDWRTDYIYAQDYLRGTPQGFAYFPFAVLTVAAATIAPMVVGFFLIIAQFLAVFVLMLRAWVVDLEQHVLTKVQYGLILVVLSYPVLFALDRMNLEIVLFTFIAGFFYFLYVRDSPWLAALCLGAAIAFKLYPATLLLLLLAERRFRPLALTVVFSLGLTAIGAVLLSALGHYSLADVWGENARALGFYQQVAVIDGAGVQHGHSIWGLVGLWDMVHGLPVAGWQTNLYAVAAAMIFLGLAVYVVFRETERWKRVLFALVPALLLPYVSADYTLIHLYFPLVFFLNAPRVSRWNVAYVGLFGLLLVPVDYYYVLGDVSISVIVYPVALSALLLLAMLDPNRGAMKDAHGEPVREARNEKESPHRRSAERSRRQRSQLASANAGGYPESRG